MNIEELIDECLSFDGAEECFSFDDETLVFKVEGKIFAYIPLESPDLCVVLKCNAERAVDLRDQYSSIQPAYHMNKKYWNTVFVTPEITVSLLHQLIEHSYHEVLRKLPKKVRDKYKISIY
jgi:predicted DNA-binding protein (MmcQ/YjbR family)